MSDRALSSGVFVIPSIQTKLASVLVTLLRILTRLCSYSLCVGSRNVSRVFLFGLVLRPRLSTLFFTINDDTLPPVPPEYEWLSTVEWMQIGLFGAKESLLGSQVWVLCKLPDQQETQAHYWLCGR